MSPITLKISRFVDREILHTSSLNYGVKQRVTKAKMTFYDSEMEIPDLPRYEDVLNDCPAFQQSLKYWSKKAGEVGSVGFYKL